jgi:hypothetical protein
VNRKIEVTILFSVFLLFSAGSNQCLGQQDVFEEIDLRDSWRVFNEKTKTFESFSTGERKRSVRWRMQFEEGNYGRLEILAPKESYVLINGKYYNQVNEALTLHVDSLLKEFGSNVFDFTIFRNSGLSATNLRTVYYKRVVNLTEGLPQDRKSQGDFSNFFVLMSFIILAYIGILFRRFPRDTLDYFSFQRSLSFKNREETLVSTRPFNRTNILFITLNSGIIAFLLVALVQLTNGYVYFPFVFTEMNLSQSLLSWLFTTSIVLVSFLLKYLLMSIFISLFRLGDFRYIQHFNSLRFSFGSFLLIFILITITYLAFRTEGLGAYFLFTNILVTLLIMRMVVLFFKLRDYTSYRNFHLFSYLCGTELIPFIIVYKLVLG